MTGRANFSYFNAPCCSSRPESGPLYQGSHHRVFVVFTTDNTVPSGNAGFLTLPVPTRQANSGGDPMNDGSILRRRRQTGRDEVREIRLSRTGQHLYKYGIRCGTGSPIQIGYPMWGGELFMAVISSRHSAVLKRVHHCTECDLRFDTQGLFGRCRGLFAQPRNT